MLFSITVVHVLFTLIQSAFTVLATIPGYDCDNTFIPGKRLQEVVDEAYKIETKYRKKTSQRARYKLSKYHDGPPFLLAYNLWPVSPTTKRYSEAEKTPYRAVIDENSRLFSVVIKDMDGSYVKECKMIDERTNIDHVPFDFDCSGRQILNEELRRAANYACPYLGVFATQLFPARLPARKMDKSHQTTLFDEAKRHLYISPVSFDKRYTNKYNPGTRFVVMDSACKVVSAIEETGNFDYVECRALSLASSPHNRYPEH